MSTKTTQSVSPSHSSSCVLSGRVPVSLPEGVSKASRLMSRDGVSSGVADSAAAEKPSCESLQLRVTLRDGATRRFLAPPPTVPDRARLVGGAEGRGGDGARQRTEL